MTINLASFADSIHQAWNSRDIESLLSLYSPEFVGNDVGQAYVLHGHMDLRSTLCTYWNAFPDLQFVITDCVWQGSRVAVVWAAEGTHQGTIMNIPPTGHRVAVTGMFLLDVKDGLIVHGQSVWDLAGMLRHLGLLPKLTEQKLSRE